ncbi:carboxylesterase/lipase family protein [Henriciella litoralis]|uniref:carboxylesterase/lipase family protein n=1 Tax=Henriciella litoralis TaxID=568102 RepID=UPI000A040337|nr:carboxylesterase family protein [Henriciella litoralis]
MTRRTSALIAMSLAALALSGCSNPDTQSSQAALTEEPASAAPLVSVAQGDVEGVSEDGINVFRGIPYAAPPVGDLRWAPPAAPAAWDGVRDATAFGPSCIQPPVPPTSVYNDPPETSSEDCLSLNVWAPADAEDAPVIVWIHGGSLRIGGAAQPVYDGTAYADRGVVFVSINYRLGVLGWLAHPGLMAESEEGLSGNYGLMDQIAALEWVEDNIEAFGGDPSNVTVMGESAGALSVSYLLTSPPAEGLFDKAIIESTNTRNFAELGHAAYDLPAAEAEGADLFDKLGFDTLEAAREADAQYLINRTTLAGYAPAGTVDGKYVPRQLNESFDDGAFAKVPVLAGFNSGEARTYRMLLPKKPDSAEAYEAAIRARYGDKADAFLALYPSDDMEESMLAVNRDNVFGWSTERIVRRASEAGQPAYFYVFDHCYPTMAERGLCAFHASEVPFVFGTVGDLESYPAEWPKPPVEEAEALSSVLVDYWASFAATGEPESANGPDWAPYNEDEAYLHIGDAPELRNDAYPGMFEFHEALYQQRREAGEGWFMRVGLGAEPLE